MAKAIGAIALLYIAGAPLISGHALLRNISKLTKVAEIISAPVLVLLAAASWLGDCGYKSTGKARRMIATNGFPGSRWGAHLSAWRRAKRNGVNHGANALKAFVCG